ncbi:hypothetical protein [Streptomyces sp. NPDC088733]|uniref:hypothetical protein n=1 Tax=Streptomyces sp. NPDC088733 TaxID=3365880 RepID=UPI003805171C
MTAQPGSSYDLRGLESLDGFPFRVFASPGGAPRGRAVAERTARTVAWLQEAVVLPATPPLFVVGPENWEQVATFPVYGMPHVELDRIVVGQRPAAFWTTAIEAITPHVDSAGLDRLRQVYGNEIDLGSFADLLVSHELTHLAHMGSTSWGDNGRVSLWLSELAANLGLQGYVQEVEPDQAERLETAFEVTWASPGGQWPVRTLPDMRDSLRGDGSNYVWFEFGLQVLAKRLWETAGVAALQTVVDTLRGPALDFDQVVKLLDELDPWVAGAVREWPVFPNGPRSRARPRSNAGHPQPMPG